MISRESKIRAKQTTRIGIVTASWGRSKIVGRVLDYYTNLHSSEAEFVRVIAMSADDPDPIEEPEGWSVVWADNAPLGKKFNTAAHVAIEMGVNGIIVIGSDDLLSRPYIDLLIDRAKRGYDYVMPNEMCIYQPGDDVVRLCLSAPPGAGRYLSARMIERMAGNPWDSQANTYLDQSMAVRMRGLECKSHSLRDMYKDGFIVLDIKTAGNKWELKPSDKGGGMALVNTDSNEFLYIRRTISFPADQFMAMHFPHFDYRAL